jgi:hypothetical protein
MRVIGFRCDGCGKEHLYKAEDLAQIFNRSRQASLYENIPSNWYSVFQGSITESQEPLMFCSKECVRYHPLKRTEEEQEHG